MYTIEINGNMLESNTSWLFIATQSIEEDCWIGATGRIFCNDIPLLKFTVTSDGVVWEGLN